MPNPTTTTTIFTSASPLQALECDSIASTTFNAPLTPTAFIARESYMSSLPLASNGGLKTWCLCANDETRRVLATCKTIRREVLVTDGKGTREDLAFCVGNVVVREGERGRGRGGEMLGSLGGELDGIEVGEEEARGCGSLLYSAKEEFYEKFGWEPHYAPAIILPVPNPHTSTPQNIQDITFLREADLSALCARDVAALTTRTQNQALPSENHIILTILPTLELVSWLQKRANFMAQMLFGHGIQHKGCMYKDRAWLYWHHDFRKERLFIQRVVTFFNNDENGDEDERAGMLAQLLTCAIQEAQDWKLKDVVIWGASADVRSAVGMLEGVEPVFEERRRETVSVRWRGGEEVKCVVEPDEHFAWS